MAETRPPLTIGNTWTLIAEGEGDRDAPPARITATGPFVLCVTVGKRTVPPTIPALSGHRVADQIDFPLAGEQRLWASAFPAVTVTVT